MPKRVPYKRKAKPVGIVSKLVKDVKSIKKDIRNEELKEFMVVSPNPNAVFGQVFLNTNGYFFQDLSCVPALGTSKSTRTGNKIVVSKINLRGQVWGQTNTISHVNYKLFIVKTKGFPLAISGGTMSDLFYNNTWLEQVAIVNVIDLNSKPNTDRNSGYQIIKTIKGSIQATNAVTITNLKSYQSFNVDINLNLKVMFSGSGVSHTSGQVFLVALADCGNTSVTNSGVTIIPVSGALTGLNMCFAATHFYTDD